MGKGGKRKAEAAVAKDLSRSAAALDFDLDLDEPDKSGGGKRKTPGRVSFIDQSESHLDKDLQDNDGHSPMNSSGGTMDGINQAGSTDVPEPSSAVRSSARLRNKMGQRESKAAAASVVVGGVKSSESNSSMFTPRTLRSQGGDKTRDNWKLTRKSVISISPITNADAGTSETVTVTATATGNEQSLTQDITEIEEGASTDNEAANNNNVTDSVALRTGSELGAYKNPNPYSKQLEKYTAMPAGLQLVSCVRDLENQRRLYSSSQEALHGYISTNNTLLEENKELREKSGMLKEIADKEKKRAEDAWKTLSMKATFDKASVEGAEQRHFLIEKYTQAIQKVKDGCNGRLKEIELDRNQLASQNQVLNRKISKAVKKYRSIKTTMEIQKGLVASFTQLLAKIFSKDDVDKTKRVVGEVVQEICGAQGIRVFQDCFQETWKHKGRVVKELCETFASEEGDGDELGTSASSSVGFGGPPPPKKTKTDSSSSAVKENIQPECNNNNNSNVEEDGDDEEEEEEDDFVEVTLPHLLIKEEEEDTQELEPVEDDAGKKQMAIAAAMEERKREEEKKAKAAAAEAKAKKAVEEEKQREALKLKSILEKKKQNVARKLSEGKKQPKEKEKKPPTGKKIGIRVVRSTREKKGQDQGQQGRGAAGNSSSGRGRSSSQSQPKRKSTYNFEVSSTTKNEKPQQRSDSKLGVRPAAKSVEESAEKKDNCDDANGKPNVKDKVAPSPAKPPVAVVHKTATAAGGKNIYSEISNDLYLSDPSEESSDSDDDENGSKSSSAGAEEGCGKEIMEDSPASPTPESNWGTEDNAALDLRTPRLPQPTCEHATLPPDF